MSQKALPIGIDDFKKIITEDYYFVDKTKMIKDLLTYKTEVTLITRPRRFGKTLNMSMLRYFFEKTESENCSLFQNLKIFTDKEKMEHCGKYPVIFLTLKDVKCNTWKETYQKIKGLIIDEFTKHDYLLKENILKVSEKKYYERILDNAMELNDTEEALKKLSYYLERYYKEKVVILVDE